MNELSLFDISGKVIIITGGSGALGGSMASPFIKAGCENCNS